MKPEAVPTPAPPEARLDVRRLAPTLKGVVGVAGGASNAGKTRIMEILLRAFAAEGVPTLALKVTRTHVAVCPRGNDACGTCDSLTGAFEVVRDPARIAVPGKDTGRYVAAGAAETRWLLARPDAMAEGIRAALIDPPPGAVLIAEGNSFVDWTASDVAVMAIWDGAPLKASALHVLDRVDAFVRRRARDGRDAPPPREDVPCLDAAGLFAFVAGRLAVAGRGARGR